MNISKDKDNLIIKIPLYQYKNNCYDEEESKELTDNLVGVIASDGEQGFYQVCDLSYKDSSQLGMPLVLTNLEDDEFRKLCKSLNISIWEYEKCGKCGKTIWGSSTWRDGHSVCWDCEKK